MRSSVPPLTAEESRRIKRRLQEQRLKEHEGMLRITQEIRELNAMDYKRVRVYKDPPLNSRQEEEEKVSYDYQR